ncbi:MAG: RNA 2',3'-cyclic phosphodiesterase, partial [Solirubrobacterales bacterium]|nr:RNA 2',3'-cyclic phosphodiesterase [Solirubrobacterales bacterium]
ERAPADRPGERAPADRPGERARLFIALELPAAVREAVVAWRSAAVRDAAGLRLIRPEDLHVTLCFLGWQDAAAVGSIVSACTAALAGRRAAALEVAEAIWLPARRPRVLAIALTDRGDGLFEVQGVLSRVLAAGGWYRPETRPFLAHVTVARVAQDRRSARRGTLREPPAIAFEGSRVTLYRSRLGAGGARYEALASRELVRRGA